MARSVSGTNRSLTLTEELERLEQSITLTLQEIDHNFSRAHRIVTTSILPIVQKYGEHSQEVWEGTKFWKQFFEASANVSLSGYEEVPPDQDTTYATESMNDTTSDTPRPESSGRVTPEVSDHIEQSLLDDDSSLLIDSPSHSTGVHSTPRAAGSSRKPTRSPPPSFQKPLGLPERPRQKINVPSTPLAQHTSVADAFSSPFEPPSAVQSMSTQRSGRDPLLHRVLDKTYRIQATPRTAQKTTSKAKAPTPTAAKRSLAFDSSPASSPAIAPPQLRSDFFSPAPRSARKMAQPHTPGARSPDTRYTSTGRAITRPAVQRTPALWDSDDEDSGELDLSPPKTMQFSVPNRLVATPAREASRRIVADLLREAGAGDDESEDLGAHPVHSSPGYSDDD